jgi:hypothetical protein
VRATQTPSHPGAVALDAGARRHGVTPGGLPLPVPVTLALAPVLVVLILRLPLINQLNYADAWFYTSYAWVPKHDFAIFGWNYFSVRFPPILTIGAFQRVFGAGDGYVILRYLLAVTCSSSVYLCVKRFAPARIALAASVLLYLDPFFSRMLLWDYSGFLEVAAGVVGVALWYWSEDRRLLVTILPGIALSVAVFSNALFGTALVVLLLVEAVDAVRGGREGVLRYGARLLVCAGCGVLVFLLGYLSYLMIVGSLGPYDLLRPTIEFFGENSEKSAPYQHAISSWLLHEPRVWAPVVLSFALIATLRGRLLGRDVAARIAQFCIAYTAFLWLYRLLVVSAVIEQWFAYSVTIVATVPAAAVLLNEICRDRARAVRALLAPCIAFALLAILIRDVSGPAGDVYEQLSIHSWLVVVLIVVGLLAAVLGALRSRLQLAGLTVLAAVLALMSFAPSVLDGRGTTGIFVTQGAQEWTAYKAAERFVDIVQNYDSPSHRVFLWFPGEFGYVSITWTDLPQDADTLNQPGVPEGLTALTPLARARLSLPTVKYVMILSSSTHELAVAREALASGGFPAVLVRSGELAKNSLSYALVELGR